MSKYGFVIRAYNAEEYIKRTIESVMRQRFRDWTAVVVDDGSVDNTVGVVHDMMRLDDRIGLLQQKRGGCVLATLNGVKNLECEYICVLDSDDWIDERYLEEADRIISEFDVDIVNHGMTIHYDDGCIQEVRLKEKIEILNRDDFLDWILDSTAHGVAIKIIKREKFEFNSEVLQFFENEKTNLNFNEDTYQIIPIACNSDKCAILDSAMYHYIIYGDSISHDVNPWEQVRFICMTMLYIEKYLESQGMLTEDRRKKILKEFVRELLPRARYIVKRFYVRGGFRLRTQKYCQKLSFRECFSIARKHFGTINTIIIAVFLIAYR